MLDDRLRMDSGFRIPSELPHRRRPPQALGRSSKLREDLLVGVAPAHACAEGRKLGLVDPHGSALG
jgi:hypothetical protein